MSPSLRSRFVLSVLFVTLNTITVCAQPIHGINSDGRDFFLGYMPAIVHAGGFTNTSEAIYVLIASYQDNNTFTVSYFDANGVEVTGPTHFLDRCQSIRLPLNSSLMRPTKPGEIAEWKAAHIHSRYPVSVQFYSDGSSAGGMYQAIPVAALGRSYVIAAWVDNPLLNDPSYIDRDSSSSEFMIVAPFNNTVVTFTPNSTTYAGVIGVNTGEGHTGQPHPVTITLDRGQVYWVRSNPTDSTNDMSGSTIVASKPIAVLGGQERALFPQKPQFWASLDNDIRDLMIEQMTPVEDWGTDYPSIPSMPATGVSDVSVNGNGDMYRIFSNDLNAIAMNMWQDGTPPTASPATCKRYSTGAHFDNVTASVDLLAQSKDSIGQFKRFYALQYQYFQGHHDFDSNGIQKNSKGASPQTETSARSSNETNLVPIDRWRLSTVFCVPQNSFYHGYQFVNIITTADSLSKIFVTYNDKTTEPLSALIPAKKYDIPLHPELTGITLKLTAGTYLITGNTPFVCYSYGRTETVYKDIWGYAAPTGQTYGSRTTAGTPQVEDTLFCGHWDVRVYEPDINHEGIADVMLLKDQEGFYYRPPQVSTNCTIPRDPVFEPGDSSVSVSIQIQDPSKPAHAALYAVDRAGNDTVITLNYIPVQLQSTDSNIQFSNVKVNDSACSSFELRISSSGSFNNFLIDSALLAQSIHAPFRLSTSRRLPFTAHFGDTIHFTVCFTARDTNEYADSITLAIGCNTMSIPVSGKAFGPLNGIASYAEASQSIVAYPDPASAIVKAALPVNEAIKSLEVLDNNDRAWQPAYKLNGTELNVDLKQLPAGSYYLRIVNVTGKHYLAKFTKE